MSKSNGRGPARGTSKSGKPVAAARPPCELPPRDRAAHERWLLEVTQIPTAAGREWRVIHWLREWVAARPQLTLIEDRAGNLVITPRPATRKSGRTVARRLVYITAHLDHPAFVVERIIGPGTVELAFRGGVSDEYFPGARIVLHVGGNAPDDPRPVSTIGATITGEGQGVAASPPDGSRLFKTYIAEIDDDPDQISIGDGHDAPGPDIRPGDIATWSLPPAEIDDAGIIHTNACDDLSTVAAAVSALDTLIAARAAPGGGGGEDVRLLFTRSEEIGFTGAIAACKLKTIPKNARVVALENSRSFADSPIGGGPIVRVGDRLTVFSPGLTAACAKRAEEIAGHAASPTAAQKTAHTATGLKWQRKLMAGGACEATVYSAYGHEATCLCLPLGNYHNMSHLQAVQDGTYDRERLGPPRCGREFIALSDYHGLIDLLVAIGLSLPEQDPVIERIEKLYQKHAFVLEEGRQTPPPRGAGGRGQGGGPKKRKTTKKKLTSRR